MIPLWESRGLIGSLLDLLYEILARFALAVIETGFVPDALLRRGIKLMCWLRLREIQQPTIEHQQKRLMDFVGDLRRRPVAEQAHAPNQQHYEIPTEFFLFCLGRNMKYSAGLYRDFDPRTGLDAAESAMLALTCERAKLGNGQNILDLGCGWGSLSLYAAANFPGSRITAVSSSKTHKEYIETRAKERSLRNLTVILADLSDFSPPAVTGNGSGGSGEKNGNGNGHGNGHGNSHGNGHGNGNGGGGGGGAGYGGCGGGYDRVVCVEALCHLKNYEAPDGLFFAQSVVHREWPYHFEPRGEDDWMARHFATGATMPCANLLAFYQESVLLEDQWALSGLHCAMTAEDWLRNLDRNRPSIKMLFDRVYGSEQSGKWLVYWRLFFLSCAETFAYNGGEEWYVAQYLFRRSKGAVGQAPDSARGGAM